MSREILKKNLESGVMEHWVNDGEVEALYSGGAWRLVDEPYFQEFIYRPRPVPQPVERWAVELKSGRITTCEFKNTALELMNSHRNVVRIFKMREVTD